MSTDKAYARCKACDRSFYPSWRADIDQYEDLCWSCMKVSQYTARVDPVMYGSLDCIRVNPDKWEQTQGEETSDYLRNLVMQCDTIPDSLIEQDEWTQGTGIESGEWFGVDNPFDTYEV